MKIDSSYSFIQVIKFTSYRNLKTFAGYYLDNISNVDSIAVYLSLEL